MAIVVNDLVGDDGVALLDRVAQERGARDTLDLRRHALHPRFRLLRPGDDLLGLDVERRIELAAGEQHVARGQSQEVLGVGAEVDLVLVRVHADAPQDEEPRLLLADERQDLLEALAVEQRDGQLDARVGRELPADLEVRLVDLGQPGIDDLLVQLLCSLNRKIFDAFSLSTPTMPLNIA